jgi:hypothetical protein
VVILSFCSGRAISERRDSGVGFAIKSKLVCNFVSLPKGLNDGIWTLQIPLGSKHVKNATLISAYAPTMTNPDDVKYKFYDELNAIISSVPRSEELILLGDFNARVGQEHQLWSGILGVHDAHDVYEGFHSGIETYAATIDLEDAYNKVLFVFVMDRLIKLKLGHVLLNWISAALFQRKVFFFF